MPNYVIHATLDSTPIKRAQIMQAQPIASGLAGVRYSPLLTDVSKYVFDTEAQSTAYELQFQVLAHQWRRETRHLSSDNDIAMNRAYQSIIGMGQSAIPLILRDLQQKPQPDHWFWALTMISHENPVPPEEAGDMRRMRGRWLEWGRRRGYLRERWAAYADRS